MEQTLVKCLHGSRLYGTHTEDSDWDYQYVFLNSFREMAVNNPSLNKTHSEGDKEFEGTELTEFIEDLLNLQPYALEMIYAPPEETDPLWHALVDLWESELKHKKIDAFRGFAYSMRQKYGDKGKRFKAFKHVKDVLEQYSDNARLSDAIEGIVRQEYISTERGEHENFLVVGDKRYGYRTPIYKVLDSVTSYTEKYGDRVTEGPVVDYKALAHAYRLLTEYEYFLINRRLDFPLPNRDKLKAIRGGDIQDISEEIDDRLGRIDDLYESSDLPAEPQDDELAYDFANYVYRERVLKTSGAADD